MMIRSRLLPLLAVALSVTVGRAENVDPGDEGHQWAWSENTGWINAQPLGPGGPGAQVDDFHVSGFLWSENAGWINLGCRADGTCDDPRLGVRNDGRGNLAGFAWAENVGFVNFAPEGGGVHVSPDGAFTGRAWGENIGWIEFSLDGAYAVRTAWRCAAGPAPSGVPQLSIVRVDGVVRLDWTTISGATHYDAVSGGLATLRATDGDFGASAVDCLAAKTATRTASDGSADPPPHDGRWYLVRGANCGATGTWNDPTTSLSRDPGLAIAPNTCP